MNCSKCGRKIPSHSRFCLYCGERIIEEWKEKIEPVESEVNIEGIRIKDDPVARKKLAACMKIYYGWFQGELTKKIDFSTRPIQWISQDGQTYNGELNSIKGEATLDESNLFWTAEVKSAERKFYKSEIFSVLSEALDWMEESIYAAQYEPIPEPEPKEVLPPPFELTDEYRERLADRWIDPVSIDTEYITFEPVIDCEHTPESFETYTLLTGEQMRCNETYPSTTTIILRTGLNGAKINCQEWTDGRYRITGLTHFYQAQQAIISAQALWDNSKILELFKGGKIITARYGYREIETGYTDFIGGCAAERKAWLPRSPREEYLQERALRYTLINALDVTGYRSLLQLTYDITDEHILRKLHQFRAECKYVPTSASAESLQWLKMKDLEDRKSNRN